MLLCISTLSKAQWQKLNGPEGGYFITFERVNNQIWTGTKDGIYTSSDEGLTWSKSNLVPGICSAIKNYNDTVVIINLEMISDIVYLKSITSFDNGNTWSTPFLIDSVDNIYYYDDDYPLIKTFEALYVVSAHGYYMSTDDGLSWQKVSASIGFNPSAIVSDGTGAIISKTTSTYPYRAHYFTSDGVSPLTLVDSTFMMPQLYLNNNVIISYLINNVDSEFVWIRTDDFGVTWDTVLLAPMTNHYGYMLYNYNNILYITNTFTTYESVDNGINWQPGILPSTYLLRNGVMTTFGNFVTTDYTNIVTYFPSTDTILTTTTGAAGQLINCLYNNKGVLFCSDQSSIYRSVDAGLTWTSASLWNWPTNKMIFRGDTVFAISNDINKLLARSFDNGITWDTINTGNDNSQYSSIAELNGRLYLSRDSLSYSDDQGSTWSPFTNLPTGTVGSCALTSNNNDVSLTVFNNELWAVNRSGFVFKYDNLSQTWINKFCYWSTGAHTQNEIIALDQVLLLRSRNAMYISQDSGETWIQSLYIGVPVYTNGDLVIPRNCIQIGGTWFGTCGVFGVYYSNDFGNTWQPLSSSPEFRVSGGLANLNGVLYSGSFWDGVWRRSNPYMVLTGNIFHDVNANGFKDSGEASLRDIKLTTVPSGYLATSNANGNYSIISDMQGTLKAILPSQFGSFSPSAYSFSSDTSGLDFAFTLDSGIFNLTVDITNVNVFNPGFQTILFVTGRNPGSEPQIAEIKVVLDTALQYNYAVPPPTSVQNDTLIWNSFALDFNESVAIKIFAVTELGTPLGYMMNATAIILPLSSDTLPADNVCILRDSVVGSYDPNDKTCLQGAYFTSTQLANNTELEYVIRFQNTGTFPTNFVIITDTLSHLFDPTTLRMISSSHPMTWELNGQGVLKVTYNPLALPPSIVDEPGSHGYVKFGIKCKETVVLGNALANTANIYFDFNPPIITNTTVTLVADPTILSEQNIVIGKEEGILVYPNPARNEINIASNKLIEGLSIVSLFNGIGQTVYSQKISNIPFRIDLSNLPAGLYIGKVNSIQGDLIGNFRLLKVD
jgi:photosystem II stability/assembly factor-like uncharacterized protein